MKTPAPDGSESSKRTVRALWPRTNLGETRPLGDEFVEFKKTLDAAKKDRDDAEAHIAEIENKIRAAIGDAEVGSLPDGGRFTLRSQTRAEHVVKESTFRVLRYSAAKPAKERKR
jgi:hypothetical protein